MTDWWTSALAMQREAVKAQKLGMDAVRKGVGAGDALVAWQEAGHKVADANMAAWKAWSKLWGGR